MHVHPRSPHARVDVLASVPPRPGPPSTARWRSPTRSHPHDPVRDQPPAPLLPAADRRRHDEAHVRRTRTTGCPHKGFARYWTVTTADGRVRGPGLGLPPPRWPESLGIGGLVCFYNEKVDLEIDGVVIDRPRTHFS